MELIHSALDPDELGRLESALARGGVEPVLWQTFPAAFPNALDTMKRIEEFWSSLGANERNMLLDELARQTDTFDHPERLDVGNAARAIRERYASPPNKHPAPDLRELAREARDVWLARGGELKLGRVERFSEVRVPKTYALCRFVASVFLAMARHHFKSNNPVQQEKDAIVKADSHLRALRDEDRQPPP